MCVCVCVVCMYQGKRRGEEERETVFIFACFFPAVLTEEQRQNLSMFIDPVTKFFEVCARAHVSFLPDQQP